MRRSRFITTLLSITFVLPSVSGAATTALDLSDNYAIKIEGAARVGEAGDVNGDGIPDMIVSRGDIAEQPERGRTWVVFGRIDKASVRLQDLGAGGYVIEGAGDRDRASRSIGVGDVNGDGLDDVAVGAPDATNGRNVQSGVVYVVFGKTDANPVQLRDFDLNLQMQRGFRIDGPSFGSITGEDIGSPGDMNGDGLSDILVGAPFTGATYVVWGKEDALPVDLLAFEEDRQTNGFRIDTGSPNYSDGYSVSGAGDVNDDGTPDVIVGIIPKPGANGHAYVIHGKTSPAPIKTKSLGQEGFEIKGTYSGSSTGYSVAGAGDVNGDGIDDVIVGAPAISCCGSGAAFVVFGKRNSNAVSLETIGHDKAGFRIKGARTSSYFDNAGASVDGLGDVDEDGLADVVVGAIDASYRGRPSAGATYVIFGKKSSRRITLAGSFRGYRIDGASARDGAGSFVAGIGDINGDGLPDVMIGAPYAGATRNTQGNEGTGEAYVVWGRAS